METTIALKRCGRCTRELPLEQFYRERSRKDGLAYRCKTCTSDANRRNHARHRDARLAAMRQYGASPRGKQAWRVASSRKRARRRDCDVRQVTERDLRRLNARFRGLCAYCKEDPATTWDHVIPLALGGRHSIGNLVPACAPCNNSKFVSLLIEWIAR